MKEFKTYHYRQHEVWTVTHLVRDGDANDRGGGKVDVNKGDKLPPTGINPPNKGRGLLPAPGLARSTSQSAPSIHGNPKYLSITVSTPSAHLVFCIF